VYRTDVSTRHRKNPFIAALSALPSDAALAHALERNVLITAGERALPAAKRIELVGATEDLVVPLPRLVALARSVLKLMLDGYVHRRPNCPEDNAALQSMYELQQRGDFSSAGQAWRAQQYSMALIGASGCGKSFSLEHITGLFPSLIWHELLGRWQIPFLFIEMSYDGESIHTLASEIFQELDRLLPEEKYSENFMERCRLNAMQRLAVAFSVARQHAVGMIIVDEANYERDVQQKIPRLIKDASSNRSLANGPTKEKLLSRLLATASNVSHIPLLFSGTLEVLRKVSPRFSQARRMSGRGSGTWHPLCMTPELGDTHSEYEMLHHGLAQCQWVRSPLAPNRKSAEMFYQFDQGFPDIAVKLWSSVQVAAIATGREEISSELVANVFKKEFVMTSYGLTAARTKERVLMDLYPDVFEPDVGRLVSHAKSRQNATSSTIGRPRTHSRVKSAKMTKSRR
jgi:hypothetical protein